MFQMPPVTQKLPQPLKKRRGTAARPSPLRRSSPPRQKTAVSDPGPVPQINDTSAPRQRRGTRPSPLRRGNSPSEHTPSDPGFGFNGFTTEVRAPLQHGNPPQLESLSHQVTSSEAAAMTDQSSSPPPWATSLIADVQCLMNVVQSAGLMPASSTTSQIPHSSAHISSPPPLQFSSHDTRLADHALQSIVGQASGSITGAPQFSDSSPLAFLVSQRVKDKIWAGSFVEMSELLDRGEEDTFTFQVNSSGGHPSLHLVPQRSNTPLTISAWIRAFNRFSAILTEQTPNCTSGLAHHSEQVMNLAGLGANWRMYDTQFRKLVAEGRQSWGVTNMELYLKAHLEKPIPKQSGRQAEQNRPSPPKGACFKYHSSGYCFRGRSCLHQHSCYLCLGNHPASRCSLPHKPPYKILPRFSTIRPPFEATQTPENRSRAPDTTVPTTSYKQSNQISPGFRFGNNQ